MNKVQTELFYRFISSSSYHKVVNISLAVESSVLLIRYISLQMFFCAYLLLLVLFSVFPTVLSVL